MRMIKTPGHIYPELLIETGVLWGKLGIAKELFKIISSI